MDIDSQTKLIIGLSVGVGSAVVTATIVFLGLMCRRRHQEREYERNALVEGFDPPEIDVTPSHSHQLPNQRSSPAGSWHQSNTHYANRVTVDFPRPLYPPRSDRPSRCPQPSAFPPHYRGMLRRAKSSPGGATAYRSRCQQTRTNLPVARSKLLELRATDGRDPCPPNAGASHNSQNSPASGHVVNAIAPDGLPRLPLSMGDESPQAERLLLAGSHREASIQETNFSNPSCQVAEEDVEESGEDQCWETRARLNLPHLQFTEFNRFPGSRLPRPHIRNN